MLNLKPALLSVLLLCSSGMAFAENSIESPEPIVYLEKRDVLKLTDAQFQALIADDNYDPSHSEKAYALYMTDVGYGRSDQYIDGIVRFSLQSDYKKLVAVINEKNKKDLITATQTNQFLQQLKKAKADKQLDTAYKANLIVELDNKMAQNIIVKNHPEMKFEVENRPENIGHFDVNQYYANKFAIYIRTVENNFETQVSPYEQRAWQDRAYVTPITTIYRLVGESHLKPKLRSLVENEVRYGKISDYEKTLIMWWMDQLK